MEACGLGLFAVGLQQGIGTRHEAVEQGVERVVVGVEDVETARQAGFEGEEFGEVGVILDLVVADQLVDEAAAEGDEAPRESRRVCLAVGEAFGFLPDAVHQVPEGHVPVEPEGGEAVKGGMLRPSCAREVVEERQQFGRKARAGTEIMGHGALWPWASPGATGIDSATGGEDGGGETFRGDYPMHHRSIAVYDRFLGALSKILTKAEAHCEAKGIKPEAMLTFRLFPDMFPFVKQVQLSCDFAARAAARLAGEEPKSFPDTETSFAELQARIAAARGYMASFGADRYAGAETRKITIKIRGNDMVMDGETFLNMYSLPQFYFHIATAYNILRHNGVEVGKGDYMGA